MVSKKKLLTKIVIIRRQLNSLAKIEKPLCEKMVHLIWKHAPFKFGM